MKKLELGWNTEIAIRTEIVELLEIDGMKIVFLSDLHLNKFSRKTTETVLKNTRRLQPNLILLGGDYVDTAKGFNIFKTFAKELGSICKVYAIAGNHDYFFGIEKIVSTLQKAGIEWIEKSSTEFNFKNSKVEIFGNHTPISTSTTSKILVAHNLSEFNQNLHHFKLILAGHLHGSQVVFWQKENKLYPGKFFYKWNLLKDSTNQREVIISKGLGDTIPIRYNCKKEIINIEVRNKR